MKTPTSQTTTNKNELSSSLSQNQEFCESSTTSEENNFHHSQKPFFLSSPSTLPLETPLKVNEMISEDQDILLKLTPFKRTKKDSMTSDEIDTKHTSNVTEEPISMENSKIHDEEDNIISEPSSEKSQKNMTASLTHSKISKENSNSSSQSNKNKKRKPKQENETCEVQLDTLADEGEQYSQEKTNKRKKIRKACRFNYIEHYISHHQLSHRIETDEIIFENESFIPTNYQTSQYFNNNPISFFTLVNLHKRVQKVEHIFNQKKANLTKVNQTIRQNIQNQNNLNNNNNSANLNNSGSGQSSQSQSLLQKNLSLQSTTLNSQSSNLNNKNSINDTQNKTIKSSSKKANPKQELKQSAPSNPNQIHKNKDYVNIVFEDRTHFQKSSLNQFIKKIKSLPGKGASLYSEAIEDFIQNKITLQKTVSYDLLGNFIDGLGNFYFLRVFKQTQTDLIIDHYTLSSSLIRLLGFEVSTFNSFVVAHGVPYIHDVSGNYLEYIARCMKSWVRSSENTTLDATLICADSLRIECSENIYTRTFHNADKQEYYLVETHVFRPKKSDSKDYMLSDERIRLFQQSFEPLVKQNSSNSESQQSSKIEKLQKEKIENNDEIQNIPSFDQTICKQEMIENEEIIGSVSETENKSHSVNEIISSIIINLTQNNAINNEQNQSTNKKSLKRKTNDINNDKFDSQHNIEKQPCKYRFI